MRVGLEMSRFLVFLDLALSRLTQFLFHFYHFWVSIAFFSHFLGCFAGNVVLRIGLEFFCTSHDQLEYSQSSPTSDGNLVYSPCQGWETCMWFIFWLVSFPTLSTLISHIFVDTVFHSCPCLLSRVFYIHFKIVFWIVL